MGRRTGPISFRASASMEQYFRNIGSRLSELHTSTPSVSTDNGHLSMDFSSLTIDTYNAQGKKQITQSSLSRVLRQRESHFHVSQNSPSSEPRVARESPFGGKFSETSVRCTVKARENLSHQKVSIKQKLTRALFHKKHTCCRCKRKSRSCLPNKAFNGIDIRYTCCRCREASEAVKTLFDEHSHSNSRKLSNFMSPHLGTSKSRDPVSQKTKIQNDSGYETATSCSTVASAHSAFKKPANTDFSVNKVVVKVTDNVDQDLALEETANPNNRMYVPDLRDPHILPDLHNPHIYSNSRVTETSVTNTRTNLPNLMAATRTDLPNLMAAGNQGSPAGYLRRFKERNIEQYDGYLPDTSHKPLDHTGVWSFTGGPSNLKSTSENVYDKMIKLNKPGENVKNTQKECHTCHSTTKMCFRLPWEGGWICEDCLDGLK